MDQLHLIARFSIHEGKLAEFERAAEACMEAVRANEPGCTLYDWFFNADRTACVVLETYRDSAAIFAHIENLGDRFAAILETADIAVELYGSPTPELVAALSELDSQFHHPFQRR